MQVGQLNLDQMERDPQPKQSAFHITPPTSHRSGVSSKRSQSRLQGFASAARQKTMPCQRGRRGTKHDRMIRLLINGCPPKLDHSKDIAEEVGTAFQTGLANCTTLCVQAVLDDEGQEAHQGAPTGKAQIQRTQTNSFRSQSMRKRQSHE